MCPRLFFLFESLGCPSRCRDRRRSFQIAKRLQKLVGLFHCKLLPGRSIEKSVRHVSGGVEIHAISQRSVGPGVPGRCSDSRSCRAARLQQPRSPSWLRVPSHAENGYSSGIRCFLYSGPIDHLESGRSRSAFRSANHVECFGESPLEHLRQPVSARS